MTVTSIIRLARQQHPYQLSMVSTGHLDDEAVFPPLMQLGHLGVRQNFSLGGRIIWSVRVGMTA